MKLKRRKPYQWAVALFVGVPFLLWLGVFILKAIEGNPYPLIVVAMCGAFFWLISIESREEKFMRELQEQSNAGD